jgi:hypothetical protein
MWLNTTGEEVLEVLKIGITCYKHCASSSAMEGFRFLTMLISGVYGRRVVDITTKNAKKVALMRNF